MSEIFRGDTLYDLIEVEWEVDPKVLAIFGEIKRAEFQIGNIKKKIDNPVSPTLLSFTRAQSKKFTEYTSCYLAIYNAKNEKLTADGSLTFKTHEEVVKDDICC